MCLCGLLIVNNTFVNCCRSQHYDSLQQQTESQSNQQQQQQHHQLKQPLKDATNTSPSSHGLKTNNTSQHNNNNSATNTSTSHSNGTNHSGDANHQSNNVQEPETSSTAGSQQNNNGSSGGQQQQGSRSLQCLETLAQKAGITVDDCKYDIANTLLNLDRGHDRLNQQHQEYQNSENMSEIKPQQQQVCNRE